MVTLIEKYREYVGDHPPRWGHGPWWVMLTVNVFPKAQCRTQLWCHSNPALQIAVANQIHHGFAQWVPAMQIGPFQSEEEALAFYRLWGQNSSKDRLSQVLCGFHLFDVYATIYGLNLELAAMDELRPSEDAKRQLLEIQAAAKRQKRGRMGDVFSRRYRVWELTQEPEKRVTCGAANVRRSIREKRKKEAKKKKKRV